MIKKPYAGNQTKIPVREKVNDLTLSEMNEDSRDIEGFQLLIVVENHDERIVIRMEMFLARYFDEKSSSNRGAGFDRQGREESWRMGERGANEVGEGNQRPFVGR